MSKNDYYCSFFIFRFFVNSSINYLSLSNDRNLFFNFIKKNER